MDHQSMLAEAELVAIPPFLPAPRRPRAGDSRILAAFHAGVDKCQCPRLHYTLPSMTK